MRLVLANSDYVNHMTDEGNQLQLALAEAGWKLVGEGYGEGERDVQKLLDIYQPTAVFVQDKRDWDPASGICFNRRVQFKNIGALKYYPGHVSVVVKDAGPHGSDYHRQFCEEVGANAVVTYYHSTSVTKHCPWLQSYRLVRTYHTVNPGDVPPFVPGNLRRSALGSGAVMPDVYPLRFKVCVDNNPADFGLEWLKHPGYNNQGAQTPSYLQWISQYKVHLATASSYGFALRKIIESVACGCTPITDLPEYDVLPEIDRAIIRVKPNISAQDLKHVIAQAVEDWDETGRRRWAKRALSYYDFRQYGHRLSQNILGGIYA